MLKNADNNNKILLQLINHHKKTARADKNKMSIDV
jgi:hypothetical protein